MMIEPRVYTLEERGPEGCLTDLADDATNTVWARMCAKLGIEPIAANSAQAKGNIERMHGRHQDRLVKKLRRKGAISHEVANVCLRNEYLPEHRQRLARRPGRTTCQRL